MAKLARWSTIPRAERVCRRDRRSTLDRPFDRAGIRAHAERFSQTQRFGDEMQSLINGVSIDLSTRSAGWRGEACRRMLRRHNRLLVTLYVLSDAAIAVSAFIITYALRFHDRL